MAMKDGSVASSRIETFVLLVRREVLQSAQQTVSEKLKDTLNAENSVQ
jgi:hypothetical protein